MIGGINASKVANDATEELLNDNNDDACSDDDELDDDDDKDFNDDADEKMVVGWSSNFKCCNRDIRSGCDNV